MRSGYKTSGLALVALILGACTAAPSQEATSTAIAVPTILPTPASIAPLEERLVASITIGFPDEIAFVQGFIWVKTDDGHVVQVDPATNSIVGDIKVDTYTYHHYCQGLGTDGENVWACSASGSEDHETIDVVRIDPGTKSVNATIQVDKVFDQFTMPFLDNKIWVLTGNGDKLVGIDTTTNQPSPAIDLGARCFQAATTARFVLVTCKLDNLILRIDPETMAVTERLTFPNPLNILGAEHGVWFTQGNAVLRLDPESLNPVASFASLPGDKGIFATPDAVWVRLDEGFLYRIDPASNQLVEQIEPAPGGRFYNMGSVLVTPDSIWTTAGDDDLLLRISLK